MGSVNVERVRFMAKETVRIADQIRRAFSGDAWHGPPLSELLEAVSEEQASTRPLSSGHTIHELVLHIEVYVSGALAAAEGGEMPKIYGTGDDWRSGGDWGEATARMFDAATRLARAVEKFPEERLGDTVPGRDYDFYYLFHGIVQHSLFHGGQIAMLKRATA